MIIATGSGSTAWLKSMTRVSKETYLKIKKQLELPSSSMKASDIDILEKINKSVEFSPNSPDIFFKHRELFLDPNLRNEGHTTSIEITNKTVGSSLFLDSKEFPINFEDILIVSSAGQQNSLRCLMIDQK